MGCGVSPVISPDNPFAPLERGMVRLGEWRPCWGIENSPAVLQLLIDVTPHVHFSV